MNTPQGREEERPWERGWVNMNENDVFLQSVTQAYSEKDIPSALGGAKAIKLGSWDKHDDGELGFSFSEYACVTD